MKKSILIFFISVLFLCSLFAQERARIMTYNLLNYPQVNGFSRGPLFKTIVDAAKPDILVCQEVTSATGVNQFLNNVLNNKFKAGTFYNGPDTDNAIFYKDSLFEFLGNIRITTSLRDINQFTLKHKIAGDTLIIYSVHLKASQGTSEEQQRLSEVTRLRSVTDNLDEGKYFIVLGDFNIYTASEPAFEKLLDQSENGYFLDPINALINWHNNSAARSLHTQSTRDANIGDGGSWGGMDDRFDMILVSQSVKDDGGVTYISGTYKPFGNDGNHFDQAINVQPNTAVSVEVANALHDASDHLPVFADFEFEIISGIEDNFVTNLEYKLDQNYPNPFNPSTRINFHIIQDGFVKLSVFDLLGREVKILAKGFFRSGTHDFIFNGADLASGIYIYQLTTDNVFLSKKMLLLK